jgi:hypothetical protein
MGMTFEWFFSKYLQNISKWDFLNLYFIAIKKDLQMLYQTSITLFGPPYDVMSTNESAISSNSHTFRPLYIFWQC